MGVPSTAQGEPEQLDLLSRTTLKAMERQAVRDPIGSRNEKEKVEQPSRKEETLGQLFMRF